MTFLEVTLPPGRTTPRQKRIINMEAIEYISASQSGAAIIALRGADGAIWQIEETYDRIRSQLSGEVTV